MKRTIAVLQDVLTRLGYLTGAFAPGQIDAPTLAALQRFQQIHGPFATAEPDDRTWEIILDAFKRGECVVTGQVLDTVGPIPRVTVEVRDRDLGDADHWILLGTTQTDPDGRFVIFYSMETVLPGDRVVDGSTAVADLVFTLREMPVQFEGFDVHRLPAGDLVDDDEKALGIQARPLEDVRIVVRTTERRAVPGETEFELVLAAFRAVWPQVPPDSLDDGRREPEFVARELDQPRERIEALVGAFRLQNGLFLGVVPAAILYGVARSDFRLVDVAHLALATSSQLKDAIVQSIDRRIIPTQTDEVIEHAIRSIRGLTGSQALSEPPAAGGAPYREVLRTALPDEKQQLALLQAAAGQEADPLAMWTALRAHPAFAEPGAVERAQFALQLDAVTNGHLPLMEALQQEHGITSMRGLLDLDAGKLRATIVRPEVGVPGGMPGESDSDRADAYVTGLVGQVQTAFPTETTAKVIEQTPAEAVGDATVRDGVVAALSRGTSEAMRAAGTAFDIHTTHIDAYLADHSEELLADVSEEARPAVVSALKRTQRLFRVSTSPDSLDWLLRNDYHSAFQIAEVPRQTFIREATVALGESQASMLHSRARAAGDATLMSYVQMNDALFGIYPAALLGGEDRIVTGKAIGAVVAKHMPTWQALFGEGALCDCANCRSVYSPAAYLVDLLNFLDRSTKSVTGKTPLDRLLARRPDLAGIELTCENTNTEIPYVDLVNEVLESLVVSLDPSKIPSFDTEGATADELRAAPQHTNWDAYVTPNVPGAKARLDRAVYPRGLPFDAPLAAARTYLQHLGVGRADLMSAFADGSLTNALAAERLGLNPSMFEVISGETLEGKPADLGASLDDRYAWTETPPELKLGDIGPFVWTLKRKLAASGAALAIGDVPASESFDADMQAAVEAFQTDRALPVTGIVDAESWAALALLGPPFVSAVLQHVPSFLARSGLTFQELVKILETRFVNPEAHVFEIVRDLRLPGPELLAFVQGGFQNPDAALVKALQDAALAEADFTIWARAHFDGEAGKRLRQTLLVDGPTDAGCNLDLLTIRHWDPVTRTPTEGEWLKLDRFIRLWRAVAWPLEETDLALSSLGATDITAPVLRQLAQIGEFARLLDLSIPQVVALWADPDPTRPQSLYSQRFSSRALLRLDPAFQPDWAGRVLVGAKIGEHLSALQSGLRVSGADLAVLRIDLGLTDDSGELTLDRIGSLLRLVTLARALQLNVRDLVLLRDLTGLQPFGPPTDDWAALRFAREVRRIQGSGLNPAQLAVVLADVTMPEPNAARDQLLKQLKESLQAIATDLDRASETDGSLTRHALTLLLVDPRLVDEVLAVLLGTDRATAVLPAPAAPAPVIPSEWSQRLVYEASPLSPSLSCLGALTDEERKTIEGFSTDAGYLAAVTRVHAAPRAVLQKFAAALTVLSVTSPTAGQLLAKTLFVADAAAREKIVSERLALLLDSILPSLRDRLGRTLIKQALAAVQPDAATLAFLMEGERAPGKPLMPAASDATRPLIVDFLGLVASADTTAAAQGYELLARLRRLSESLSLGAEDVRALARHLVAFRSTPGRLCTYDDWTTIASYARVRGRSGQTAGALATLWEAGSTESARAALALLLGWTEETIADLMDPAGLSLDLAKVQQLATLERLIAVGEMVVRLGVSVKQAAAWARLPIGQVAADEARRAVKTRYDEPAWLEVAGTLSDPLRDGRRAALAAYLLPRLGLSDANALYQRLLIDVEMSPCMTTSRIKQAISSTQLFVQRCLLNLEPNVPPEAIDDQDWKWMQNYRVWEANRKVLLYPENWIMPELRDDKTPFFRELESDLLQNDVSDTNVERALETYLGKLDAVAKLEIIAMHVQDDFEPDENLRTVVHLFGRTANPPQANYYRRYVVTHNGTALWTPWEPMPVDIQGTLIAPVTFNRRLYIFWVIAKPNGDSHEIGIAWSCYFDGSWSPTQMTEAAQTRQLGDAPIKQGLTIQGEPMPSGRIERFEARVKDDELRLQCITHRQFHSTKPSWGYQGYGGFDALNAGKSIFNETYAVASVVFVLGGCHGKVIVDPSDSTENVNPGVVVRLRDGTLEARPLSIQSPSPAPETILSANVERIRIIESEWAHRGSDYLVFDDERRTFLAQVTQKQRGVADVLVDADSAYPRRASTDASGGIASPTTTRSRLTATLTQAEAAGHPWATATVSLAGAGLASLASAGGAVVAGNPSQPSLADPPIHVALTAAVVGEQLAVGRSDLGVSFEPLFHPFTCSYIKALRQYGVRGVLTLGNQQLRLIPDFPGRYLPNRSVAPTPYPTSSVDFGATKQPGIFRSTAYSVYNWELFFHLPMLIAERLTQNRRFEDARRWLHYVFNPTDGTGAYWQVVPFQTTPTQSIEEWLQQLNAGDPDLQQQIAEWKDHPFEPHRIARMRLPAYKKYVVMKYLDNLIAWGDDLFKRDTIESINAATQLYVMAADLLGARPEIIPPRGEAKPMTFAELRGKLDALSNAAAEFENAVPFLSNSTMAPATETVGLLGVSRSLYFCLPPNDKLLAYWDTVADRLFKVRNCMSLAGVVRQLPLFEPPIDPALLVAAAAQGLDIGSVLGDLGAPLPHHRFRFTFQRALEACSDVKALGAALLSTLEKKDAEDLALLRATQEATLRRTMRESRRQQELEALEQVEGLKRSRATPVERLLHFRGLMGLDAAVPELGADVPIVAYDPKPSAEGGVFLIDEELQELEASHSARDWQVIAATTDILASLSHFVPKLEWPVGLNVTMAFGGEHVGPALSAIARYQATLGAEDTYDASHAGKMGSYKRRQQEYAHQANLAAREIMAVDRQITAASIRAAVAGLERDRLETEIAQADLVEHHFRSKYTNAELYGWMHGQITGLYFQSYQLALELARSAERCFRFERGLTSSNFIRSNGWDDLHGGFLAGDTLQLQLRQLERAHQEQDRRELEVTKHVSLRQNAPLALLRLRQTGRCEVELPELLYDMDYPGHYMRRVRSVSVTIPAVTGPYTSLNAVLTMLTNETRISGALRVGKFERDVENDDERFVTDFTAIQAIVTSTGQNDHGLFDPGFNDERYLPFEGAGAASRWRIELDPDCNHFDLETIADVVLHVRYTARDGGQLLAQKAKEHWKTLVADAETLPLSRLFSLKHEFPTEWHRLRNVAEANGDHVRTIAITRDRFPMLFGRRDLHVGRIDLFGVPASGKQPTKLPGIQQPDNSVVQFSDGAPLGPLIHRTATVDVNVKDEEAGSMWRLSVALADVAASIDQLDDLLLVCHYDVRPAAG